MKFSTLFAIATSAAFPSQVAAQGKFSSRRLGSTTTAAQDKTDGAAFIDGESFSYNVAYAGTSMNVGDGSLQPCPPPSNAADGSVVYAQLNSWALESFESDRDGAPAFTGLSVQPQEMMCSVVTSIYNAINAPQWTEENQTMPSGDDYFQQAARDDCNIAAVSSGYSAEDPHGMISLLSKLYWKGEMAGGLPNPRSYALELEDMSDNDWKQGPAMFVSSVGLRDSMNVYLLKQNAKAGADREEMKVLEEHSRITAEPIPGGGTQGGSGESYFTMASQVAKWVEALTGTMPATIQGGCKTDACTSLLDWLLPQELVAIKGWFIKATASLYKGETPDPYTGWSKNVQRIIDDGGTEKVVEFYQPVSAEVLVDVCRKSAGKPVYLAIDYTVLPGQQPAFTCSENVSKGMCVANHWVMLQTADACAESCTVWSWAALYTMPCAHLAAGTTTIVHS